MPYRLAIPHFSYAYYHIIFFSKKLVVFYKFLGKVIKGAFSIIPFSSNGLPVRIQCYKHSFLKGVFRIGKIIHRRTCHTSSTVYYRK